jgi:hypothetical protein
MTFDKPKQLEKHKILLDDFDTGFYTEEEDKDIDLSKIKIHDRSGSAE